MQIINKKGVTEVIVIALVILLVIIASTSLMVYFFTMNNAVQYSPSVSCLHIDAPSTVSLLSSCYNPSQGDLQVLLERNTLNIPVNLINFTLKSNLTLQSRWSCSDSCGDCSILNLGEKKTYYLSLTPKEFENSLVSGSSACDKNDVAVFICPK